MYRRFELDDHIFGECNQALAAALEHGAQLTRDELGEVLAHFEIEVRNRQWLAAAGYPNGQGLPPITLMFDTRSMYYERSLAIANYLRQGWMDELGATIDIQELEWSAYLELLETDPPQLWQLIWIADHTDAYGFLRESMAGSYHAKFGSWNNPVYEGLLDLAAATGDQDDRATLYAQAEEILVETDAVMVPIYYIFIGIASRPYLERCYDNGGYSGWIADWRMSWRAFLPFLTRNN